MSWQSTLHYYKLMNEYIHQCKGKHHSVETILRSVDFERMLYWVNRNEWNLFGKEMASLALNLESAGAQVFILTSNAAHKVFDFIEDALSIPALHIVDPTARALHKAKVKQVGLLGTKVTMQDPFYKDRLLQKHKIESIVPEKKDQDEIHRIIFEELTIGKVLEDSKKKMVDIIHKFKGIEGIILGCTELTLLLDQKDCILPIFDTTELHAKAAVDFSLGLENNLLDQSMSP